MRGGIAVVSLAVTLAVLASSAVVARAASFSWSGPIVLARTPAGGPVPLLGVVCPSASQCVAVDSAGAVVTFNPSSPGAPTPVTIDPGTGLLGIACPSTIQCTAIDGNGQQVTFNPTALGASTPTTIDTTKTLTAVACPSTTQCTAVDRAGTEVTFNPVTTGAPARTAVDAGNQLFSVACPSTSQCTAVDSVGAAVTFNPLNPGSPPSTTVDSAGPLLPGVACPSASQCVAVDSGGTVVTFDPNLPNIRTLATIDGGNILLAVACPAASECVAVDNVGRAFLGDPGNPYSWTLQPTGGKNALTGVSCSSVGQCVVVDSQGSVFVGVTVPLNAAPPAISGSAVQGEMLTETHGAWSAGPTGYAYQWQRCDSAGNACAAIPTATGQTYTLTGSDVGSTIRVQETASDAAGTGAAASSTETAVVQTAAPGGGGPPRVTRYRITNNPFVLSAAYTPIIAGAAGKTHKRGTTFRYTLSEAATVKIVISQRLARRRAGNRCVTTPNPTRTRACTRIIFRGALIRTSHLGNDSVAFSGRIGSKALKPGHYQATLTATDAAMHTSKAMTIVFAIVTR